MSNIENIIRQHGHMPVGDIVHTEEGEVFRYNPFVITTGFPQMGFSLFTAKGERHGFFYCNMYNIDLITRKTHEYINFSHSSKVVLIRGRGLHDMFEAIMNQTLQAAYEFSTDIYPEDTPNGNIIDRTGIKDTSPNADIKLMDVEEL